jgi:hypothetical protein
VQMKNWEPFVLGPMEINGCNNLVGRRPNICLVYLSIEQDVPALAMDKIPGPVCFRVKFSSANFPP